MQLNFELESDFFWVAKTKLPFWAGFQGGTAPADSAEPPAPSNGSVDIVFAPEDRDTSPMTTAELQLVRWFLDNQDEVSQIVLEAILSVYPDLQQSYGYEDQDKQTYMPDISEPDQLRNLISLHDVHIHQIQRDDMPYIGFEMNCSWDPDHGLGVLMNGTQPVQLGNAEVAFTLSLAQDDLNNA